MPKLLLIETSTEACSVAISEGEKVLISREVQEHKAHAKLLAPFIKEILDEKSLKVKDLSAVCVSEGPGSYTGLRVGISTAKGLCFGGDIPLLSVPTTDILARMGEANIKNADTVIIPMIDARRMEVYCAAYDSSCDRISEITAKVLDEGSFSEYFDRYSHIIFVGDGAEKFRNCLKDEALLKSSFIQCCPKASYMAIPALSRWNKKEFKDIAYFEPFYLKEFVAGISKKSLI